MMRSPFRLLALSRLRDMTSLTFVFELLHRRATTHFGIAIIMRNRNNIIFRLQLLLSLCSARLKNVTSVQEFCDLSDQQ